MNPSITFATLAKKEQFAHALLLAQSIKDHHPDARLVLCLPGHHKPAYETRLFDEVVLITDHGVPFDSPGGCKAAKAYLIAHLLDSCGNGSLIYLDPEVKLWSPLEELFPLLEEHEIIAVPERLEPCDRDDGAWEAERLRNGFLDAGFLAVRGTDKGRRFAAWFSQRVDRALFSGHDPAGDSKWLSLAVVPFGIHLLKDPAYQAAPRNLDEGGRQLKASDGCFTVNGRMLRTSVHSDWEAEVWAYGLLNNPERSDAIRALGAAYLGELGQISSGLS